MSTGTEMTVVLGVNINYDGADSIWSTEVYANKALALESIGGKIVHYLTTNNYLVSTSEYYARATSIVNEVHNKNYQLALTDFSKLPIVNRWKIFPVDNVSTSVVSERPCPHCGKMNNVGANECWWCGILNP
jgi:hypothetical protein